MLLVLLLLPFRGVSPCFLRLLLPGKESFLTCTRLLRSPHHHCLRTDSPLSPPVQTTFRFLRLYLRSLPTARHLLILRFLHRPCTEVCYSKCYAAHR